MRRAVRPKVAARDNLNPFQRNCVYGGTQAILISIAVLHGRYVSFTSQVNYVSRPRQIAFRNLLSRPHCPFPPRGSLVSTILERNREFEAAREKHRITPKSHRNKHWKTYYSLISCHPRILLISLDFPETCLFKWTLRSFLGEIYARSDRPEHLEDPEKITERDRDKKRKVQKPSRNRGGGAGGVRKEALASRFRAHQPRGRKGPSHNAPG